MSSRGGERRNSKGYGEEIVQTIKVDYENNGITINIYIEIEYGYTVSDIAYRVQENVKNGISYMMDAKINAIHVHVLGVNFPAESQVNFL